MGSAYEKYLFVLPEQLAELLSNVSLRERHPNTHLYLEGL